jgi:hypothetical protein
MYVVLLNEHLCPQICKTPEALLTYLNVTVSDKGIVTFGDKEQLTISYKMDEFTKSEVEADIMKNQLKQIQDRLKISIFKMTRI